MDIVIQYLYLDVSRERKKKKKEKETKVMVSYYLVCSCKITPYAFINSHPLRTTPTSPPVCMVSEPPPDNRHSISARPSSQVTRVCAGTSNSCSCSARAERISANARPLLAFRVFTVLRQDVTSLVDSKVDVISWISDGCGAAMQS